jgi:hypothetical protein
VSTVAALDSLLSGDDAADFVDSAIRQLSLEAIIRLADDIRAHRIAFQWRWARLSAEEARKLTSTRARLGVAAIFSLHRNGYVREVGLEELARTSDAAALPFFALRLDDIVPKLREYARAELDRRIDPRFAKELVALLPLVRRLSTRMRAGASATLRAIEAFAVDPRGGQAALIDATRAGEPRLRRTALVLAIRRADLGERLAPMLAHALADDDARIARWAGSEITSARAPDSVRVALLPLLERHRDPSVRRRAVLARAKAGGAEDAERLRNALLDPRAMVRRTAREKQPDVRSADVYRVVLADREAGRRDVLGALAGLAEVGRAEDAELAIPWIEASDPRLQAEAVRCIGTLAPEAYRAMLEEKEKSVYSAVRRESSRALSRSPGSSSSSSSSSGPN